MYFSMAEMSVAEMSICRNVRGRNVLAETSVAEMSEHRFHFILTDYEQPESFLRRSFDNTQDNSCRTFHNLVRMNKNHSSYVAC